MEEKEPVNGSKGGGGVKVIEEHTHGGSEGSQESKTSNVSNTGGGIRESVESMVSPSLNRLIAADVMDESKDEYSMDPEMIAKDRKRMKAKNRKKAKRDKAIKERMEVRPDDHEDDNSDTIQPSFRLVLMSQRGRQLVLESWRLR